MTLTFCLLFIFTATSAQTLENPHSQHACGSSLFRDTNRLRQAEENTRRMFPGLEQQLLQKRLMKSAGTPKLATQELFWVFNLQANRYDTVRAELLATGPASYVWVALDELANGHVTQVEVNAILEALESKTPAASQDSTKGIIDLAKRFFGNPPNINSSFVKNTGDGKTHFLVYDIIDGFTGGSFVAGYFHPKDVTPGAGNSNARDMLYIDSFPGIFSGGQRNPHRPLGTVAHELQHLIHWNYKSSSNTFLNEGLSETASFFCGYGLRSPSLYLNNTNISMLGWSGTTDDRVLADYSRAALFVYYAWDRFGEGFTKNLAQHPSSGSAGFDGALVTSGISGTFASTVREFQVANYLHDRTVNAAFGYVNPPFVGTPRVHRDNFGPVASGSQASLQPFGVEYLRFRVVDTIRTTFATAGGGNVQAVRIRDDGKGVFPVGSAQYATDFTGSQTSESTFLVHAAQSVVSYSYQSDGSLKVPSFLQLAHDDGMTQRAPYAGFAPNDTVFVCFDGVRQSRIDSVAMWFQTTGTVRLFIRDWNTNYDLSTQPLTGLGGRNRISAPITFSVTDTGFMKTVVNLQDRNVGGNTDFVVQVIYGSGSPNPLLRRDSGQAVVRSYLSISAQPTAGRTMYESVGDFYVRVYLGPSDDDTDLALPSAIVLEQNYPNPFNGETTIRFTVPDDGVVRVDIFDLLGRNVRTFHRASPPNVQTVTWDGTDESGMLVPSGVYFYRVLQGNAMKARKLVVIR